MTACILVADGVATHRITLKVRLTAACYDVQIAASTQQLLALARNRRPDLIILRGGFPDETPISLCERLAGDDELSSVPILILADGANRLAALRAGAAAVLEPAVDEQMFLARIRSLLRENDEYSNRQRDLIEPAGQLASDRVRLTLVADSPGRGLCWKHLLGQRLPFELTACDPEEALASAAGGNSADLYLIAADIETRGDGLRLLSELRSRGGSRHAGFIVATSPERSEINAIALDLGASEVLPITLGGGNGIDATIMALQTQLARKRRADKARAEAQRNLQLAMTDPLTGLYNRRYAMPHLAETARISREAGASFAVLVMDLDWFKRVNDHFGHAAGDAVLRNVAARLEQAVGPAGIVARLGGEEFLAILPGTDEAGAYRIAEAIRRDIETSPTRMPQRIGEGMIDATLSIGVAIASAAGYSSSHEALAEMLVERADQALLSAKSLGRNRVMLAQAEYAA